MYYLVRLEGLTHLVVCVCVSTDYWTYQPDTYDWMFSSSETYFMMPSL